MNGKILAASACVAEAPFGEELGAGVGIRSASNGYGADSVRQKFDGYERDSETGLDFAQARYYSSLQGRFTSPDPLIASAIFDDPQSWNRYSFVGNRPLIYTDPTGLQWGRSQETGEYKWFPSGIVDDGWDEVNIGQEYESVNGRVVLQAGGNWDYVRPPQEGLNVFRDSQLTNSMMQMLGTSYLFGLGAGGAVVRGAIAAGELLPLSANLGSAIVNYGEDGGGTALTTRSAKQAEKQINSGANNVTVESWADADAIRRNLIEGQGYRNSTGYTGNQVRNNPETFPEGKARTFHWDYADTQHGGRPHVQIHTPEGRVIRIFFEKGAGIPIRTPTGKR